MTGIGLTALLTAASLAAGPEVSVTTLSGEQHAGALVSLSRESLKVLRDGAEKSFSLSDLMELRFKPGAAPSDPAPTASIAAVTFNDGSRIQVSRAIIAKRDVALESPLWGTLKLPLPSVAAIRFTAPDNQVDKSWAELSERERKDDMLVIRKGDLLDHLDGAVGDIDEATVHFVLDNEEVPVKREKVFGILYATRKTPSQPPLCEAIAQGGDRLKLRSIAWDEAGWKATLLAGGELTVPEGKLASLDFSLGKVKALSDLDWRDMKLTAYWDTETDRLICAPLKDQNSDGQKLKLGVPLRPNSKYLVGKPYQRGLSLHSRTLLKYRINGDYRRFQSAVGIRYEMLRRELGEVSLKISGDGKTLFESDVAWNEPSRQIDLDIEGVRDLEIFVDFGKDQLPEGDELILGDARLIK